MARLVSSLIYGVSMKLELGRAPTTVAGAARIVSSASLEIIS
jgi:hypothetical protein